MNFLARLLLGHAGRLQQEDEGRGAAVHDRDFGGAQVHVGVVDAEAGEGRHQVLDRRDLDVALDQGGAQHGLADLVGVGAHVHRGIQVDAAEDDAGVLGRGTQRHEYLAAGVETHTGGANGILESALFQHGFRRSNSVCRRLSPARNRGEMRSPPGQPGRNRDASDLPKPLNAHEKQTNVAGPLPCNKSVIRA